MLRASRGLLSKGPQCFPIRVSVRAVQIARRLKWADPEFAFDATLPHLQASPRDACSIATKTLENALSTHGENSYEKAFSNATPTIHISEPSIHAVNISKLHTASIASHSPP